jgi:hypothetical protein
MQNENPRQSSPRFLIFNFTFLIHGKIGYLDASQK